MAHTGLLRRLLRRSGFDLKRYGPLMDPNLQRQGVLESRGIDLVLDGGANGGQYGGRLRNHGYTGRILSMEPGADAFLRLLAASAGDPSWEALRCALGRAAGEATLKVTANSVSSSLQTALPRMESVGGSEEVTRETVSITTAAALLEEHGADAQAPMLKLDVQGSELEALEGTGPSLDRFEVIEVELALTPLYAGQPEAHEMMAWLAARGLRPVGVAPNTIDPRTGDLLELDALFARS